jgi:hypothetical protein
MEQPGLSEWSLSAERRRRCNFFCARQSPTPTPTPTHPTHYVVRRRSQGMGIAAAAVCGMRNAAGGAARLCKSPAGPEATGSGSQQGGNFTHTHTHTHTHQPSVGPVGSWEGMEVVQGVQLGHRATWFGGGRARPAPVPAHLPPPRPSGWRPAGKAVRLFGPYAVAADAIHAPAARVTPLPASRVFSAGHGCEILPNQPSFSIFSWREARERVRTPLSLRDLSPRQPRNQQMSSGSAGSVDLLPQVPQRDLGS